MSRKCGPRPVRGVVRWFDPSEGVGAIDSEQTPGGCWVHYTAIRGAGYRELLPGEEVEFTFEALDFRQDGYSFRAMDVRRQREY